MQYWRYIYAVIYLFSFFFSRMRVLMDWGHLSTPTMCALVILVILVPMLCVIYILNNRFYNL